MAKTKKTSPKLKFVHRKNWDGRKLPLDKRDCFRLCIARTEQKTARINQETSVRPEREEVARKSVILADMFNSK